MAGESSDGHLHGVTTQTTMISNFAAVKTNLEPEGRWDYFPTYYRETKVFSEEKPCIGCYNYVKGKEGKVVPVLLIEHHTMKAYWGSGHIAPRILDSGPRWRWVVSFTPRPLYPQGKSPWYPLDRRLGGPQSLSGLGGEEKNSQPLPGLEPQLSSP
jgi:hypothetical protein